MTPERDLSTLLQQLEPFLNPGVFVFATLPPGTPMPTDKAVMQFRETEGTTLVLTQAEADALGIPYAYEAAWITLQVHSALDALGLTAAVATELAGQGISCNVVAGYHHDHLFVDHRHAERAVDALRDLSRRHQTLHS